MNHDFVDSKYNCRFGVLLHIRKINADLNDSFEGLKKKFRFQK